MVFLINALNSRKKAGGGYQIALNFIKYAFSVKKDWVYLLSEDLYQSLKNDVDNSGVVYYIYPNQPDLKTHWKVQKGISEIEEKHKPIIVYSLTSPSYFKFRAKEVLRFANAWDTNPNDLAKQSLPYKERIFMSIKHLITKKAMLRSRFIITQSQTVKEGIVKLTGIPSSNVAVVPNVLPGVFSSQIPAEKPNLDTIRIVYTAAPLPHKDHIIIPETLSILSYKYAINNVIVYLTLPEQSDIWKSVKKRATELGVDKQLVNLGYQSQLDLTKVYNQCHIGFFPTLLETFSATILEYMKFDLIVVASDFSFNREVTKEAAIYFKPHNPNAAADALHKAVGELKASSKERLMISNNELKRFESYEHHFNGICDFLDQVALKVNS